MAFEEMIDILSGRRKGIRPGAMRALLRATEWPYSGMVRMRNVLYDRGVLRVHRLPRPAVSIGNLTTGGTGKTPLVCWLGAALLAAGRKPAVLMRGYKSVGGKSDEEELIANAVRGLPVLAEGDRLIGAAKAVTQQPETDVFLLDDGMQHRRAGRDFEIVLISAAEPWGYGHVLPRGLLREPVSGVRRADAVVLTHANEVGSAEINEIERVVRRYNPAAPIFRVDHVLSNLVSADGEEMAMSALGARKYFVACGIGQPESFAAELTKHSANCAGRRFYADHYHFGERDAAELRQAACAAQAKAVVVTEKDWTKLSRTSAAAEADVVFWRARLKMKFSDGGDGKLLDLVLRRTGK